MALRSWTAFSPASDVKLAASLQHVRSTLESADKMEQHLHERMRCFQLAFWLSGNGLFQVFGALRAAELAAGASWETLKEFLPDRAASSEDRADEERMPCYNIDSESEAMSALFEEDD